MGVVAGTEPGAVGDEACVVLACLVLASVVPISASDVVAGKVTLARVVAVAKLDVVEGTRLDTAFLVEQTKKGSWKERIHTS